MAKKGDKVKVPRSKGRGASHQRKGTRTTPLTSRFLMFLRRNRALVRGCLIFFGFILAFMLIYTWVLTGDNLKPLLNFTASATGSIANLFGASADVDGSMVSSSEFSMSIVLGCTALIPTAIFLAAVLAYPCTIRRKLIGIGLGIVALFVLNLVRTVSLFFIGSNASRSFFDTAHFLIWQPVMILIAIVLWLFWVGKLTRVTPA